VTARGAHDAGAVCRCVSEHRPPVLEYERHHRLPKYLGGEDVPENVVWVCPTTHTNTHELLRMMLKASRALSYHECQAEQPRPVARYAHTLALAGYTAWLTRPVPSSTTTKETHAWTE